MLELTELQKRFGDRVALDGVSFRVEPGRLFGFLGPNGAGKTTTMRIINGISGPDSGSVAWQGAAVDEHVRLSFGYMPEERGLYPKMRLGEQVAFLAQLHGMDPRAARTATSALLERLGLGGRERDRVDALSHGNQQRAQLAAALVHDPALLILDEPFSGLDPAAVDELGGVLRERADAGAAVLFSSHQLELVERYCEEVAIIESGRLVMSGRVDDLRRERGGNQLHVRVHGARSDWADALPSVSVSNRDGDAVTLSIAGETTTDSVLDAARAAGTVTEFARVRPSLADLFREAIRA
ncbi:MAG: ABC transporter ATP-binding protein [Candidatus Dormibacteria bacterium]